MTSSTKTSNHIGTPLPCDDEDWEEVYAVLYSTEPLPSPQEAYIVVQKWPH